ncbi:MAG TPA: M10 family metallopeptidase C-terminal domain-containing protein [Azospirillaceae bacterium]|nr:M10 family metallopeptidase C-terminal domain-containing protein [Azospirillaceae bacterium]
MLIHQAEGPCACPLCAGDDPRLDPAGGTITAGPRAAASPDTLDKVPFRPEQAAAHLGRDARIWEDPVVTFGFREATPPGSYGRESEAFTPFSEAQRAATRESMALWDDVVGISFQEGPDGVSQILFGNSTHRSFQAYASQPGAGRGGDIWVNPNQASNLRLGMGDYGQHTLAHEIGHALGLRHPGEYDASDTSAPTYFEDAQFRQDTRQHTMMSYWSAFTSGATHVGTASTRYAATPLPYDVLAAQRLYGPDMATRTGDTTYGYNSTAGRAAFDFTGNTEPVVTIWDAGGADTLDLSDSRHAAVLDLRQGAFSDVNGLKGNLSIAYFTQIENAVGTRQADRITGNELPNLVTGGGGNDTIDGGAGIDTARYLGGRAGYEVVQSGSTVTVRDLSGAEGTDTLTGVERLAFADMVVDLAAIPAQPTVTLSNVRAVEGTERGGTMMFELVLSQAATQTVTVAYATRGLSAQPGQDFEAASGTVTLAPGQSSALIPVRVFADSVAEGDEAFQLVLTSVTGAQLAGGGELRATATLLEDDPSAVDEAPADATTTRELTLGQSVTGGLQRQGDADWYKVSLKAGTAYAISLQGRTSADGSLEDPMLKLFNPDGQFLVEDDDGGAGRNSLITYTPLFDGTYYVQAQAWDDDYAGTYTLVVRPNWQPQVPELSIAAARVTEGEGGTAALVFTLTLSEAAMDAVTVWAATEDGTAAAGLDYRPLSQALRFEPGQISLTVTVPVSGDRTAEGDETVTLRLSDVRGAVFADNALTLTAAGTLADDDVQSAPLQPGVLLALPDGAVLAWAPDLGAEGFRDLGGLDGTARLAADLTGDGRLDLLLRRDDGRYAVLDAAQGPGGAVPLPDIGADLPLLAGRFVGSGAADLLLRDPATGALRFLDAATGTTEPFLTPGAATSVVGAADLEGRGRDAVLFQNADTGAVIAWSGGAFRDLLTLPAGWRVAATGDFMGDRADDLLLQDTVAGTLLFWDVGRGPQGFADFLTLPPGWAVAGAGDLDLDGRDDVLMREASSGRAVVWNGSGFLDLGTVLSGVELLGIGPTG